jgi:predicted alpha/beta hydrolase family esterase
MDDPGQNELEPPDAWAEGHQEYLHSLPIVTERHKEEAEAAAVKEAVRAEIPTAAPAVPAADTAVIVCHGMGQQVPFETLNQVASALLIAEQEHNRGKSAPSVVTLLKDGDNYLPRAQVTVGSNKNVHLFEVYWAPITEGKVNSLDVLKFLVKGGCRGLSASRRGHFKRFLYDNWRKLEIKAWTPVFLLMALVVVVSLLLHYFSFVILVGAHTLPLLGFHPFGRQTTQRVTDDCCWMLLGIILVLVFFLIWSLIRLAWPSGPRWDKPGWPRIGGLYAELIVTLIAVVGSMGVAASSLVLGWPRAPHIGAMIHRWAASLSAWAGPAFPKELVLLCLAGWGYVLWKINSFIVDYVGDVAAYISAQELNKFWTVREQIQAVALRVTRFVYKQNYKQIIFVGHSLGSVVAYDALNAIIREAAYMPREHLNPVPRSKALITFGSPLDKTAFLFREHMRANGLGIREALAMVIQPVIADFPNWPKKWINIFSPADIISGSLEYYQLPDDCDQPPDARKVENQIDYEANIPLLAHNQYWTTRRLRKILYDQCV